MRPIAKLIDVKATLVTLGSVAVMVAIALWMIDTLSGVPISVSWNDAPECRMLQPEETAPGVTSAVLMLKEGTHPFRFRCGDAIREASKRISYYNPDHSENYGFDIDPRKYPTVR